MPPGSDLTWFFPLSLCYRINFWLGIVMKQTNPSVLLNPGYLILWFWIPVVPCWGLVFKIIQNRRRRRERKYIIPSSLMFFMTLLERFHWMILTIKTKENVLENILVKTWQTCWSHLRLGGVVSGFISYKFAYILLRV